MPTLHVLRVFAAPDGSHGNPLGVFLDGSRIPTERRQAVAAELGFSETVFVDDPASGRIRIFTPGLELPFAGHPTVGTAWLLRQHGVAVTTLNPPAGLIHARAEDDLTWISADPGWSPPFEYVEHGSPEEVDALAIGPSFQYAWAWADEAQGLIRARSFVAEAGIAEDEATGAAALALAARLGREVTIRQGKGSEIYARPAPDGRAEVGGRVVLDAIRDYAV